MCGGDGSLRWRARLVPVYVKPFVKRQKNDMADVEAITEAAARPTMRFVAVKSAEKQASGMVFKTRDLLVQQCFAVDSSDSRPRLQAGEREMRLA
jgi:transposase